MYLGPGNEVAGVPLFLQTATTKVACSEKFVQLVVKVVVVKMVVFVKVVVVKVVVKLLKVGG